MAAFSRVAGHLRSVTGSGTTYVQGDTNGDGVADLAIQLNGNHTLQVADFIL